MYESVHFFSKVSPHSDKIDDIMCIQTATANQNSPSIAYEDMLWSRGAYITTSINIQESFVMRVCRR